MIKETLLPRALGGLTACPNPQLRSESRRLENEHIELRCYKDAEGRLRRGWIMVPGTDPWYEQMRLEVEQRTINDKAAATADLSNAKALNKKFADFISRYSRQLFDSPAQGSGSFGAAQAFGGWLGAALGR